MKNTIKLALAIVGFSCGSPAFGGTLPAISNYSYQVPTTGFSITIPNSINVLAINPAGALAAGTVTMPPAPIDGQEVTISSTQQVVALTLTANTGQTIIGAITTLPANSAFQWVFSAPLFTWIPSTDGQLPGNPLISGGTKFTASGCSNSATIGGATAGKYASGTTGTCTVVITMNGAVGTTAPNGWACAANDITTPADVINQTASSSTTATLAGTTVSGDSIVFQCVGY